MYIACTICIACNTYSKTTYNLCHVPSVLLNLTIYNTCDNILYILCVVLSNLILSHVLRIVKFNIKSYIITCDSIQLYFENISINTITTIITTITTIIITISSIRSIHNV